MYNRYCNAKCPNNLNCFPNIVYAITTSKINTCFVLITVIERTKRSHKTSFQIQIPNLLCVFSFVFMFVNNVINLNCIF